MKKSLKKQAVFPVLMLLVVTALALIGSSFAWFAMSNVAGVNKVSGQVEKGTAGLMISQDGTNFEERVTLDSSAKTFVVPKYYHQVSTVNGQNFFQAIITGKTAGGTVTSIKTQADNTVVAGSGANAHNLYGVASYEKSIATDPFHETTTFEFPSGSSTIEKTDVYSVGTANIDSTASYMVFDLFFSVERNANLYLNFGSALTIKAADHTAAASNPAMRVAFLDMNGVDVDTVEGTIIWIPSATENNPTYYGVIAEEGTTAFTPYELVTNKTQQVTGKQSSQLFNATTGFGVNSDMAAYTPIATLTSASVNKVRVVVWLEGNDPACTATVAQMWADLELEFFAKETA